MYLKNFIRLFELQHLIIMYILMAKVRRSVLKLYVDTAYVLH